MSDSDVRPDDDGWYRARCACGWEFGGVLPDLETMIDALMDHAAHEAKGGE